MWDSLRAQLRRHAGHVDATTTWPATSIAACAHAGVLAGFVPADLGGDAWTEEAIASAWLELSGACLTTAFVMTQFATAIRLVGLMPDREAAREVLSAVSSGSRTVTLGISHLTTSHQHLGRPTLAVTPRDGGWRFDGFSPWVSGAARCDHIVTGGRMADGAEIVALVDREWSGLHVEAPARLLALDGSLTSTVRYDRVQVPADRVLVGPQIDAARNAMRGGGRSVHSSALALGLAREAAAFVAAESTKRPELRDVSGALVAELDEAIEHLLALARGDRPMSERTALRSKANGLVDRCSTAALVAAKGAGFVSGHPIGRWCREALFFRVWSAPADVRDKDMRSLIR